MKSQEKPIGLVPDELPNMWRLIWANGDKSKDYYNLSRAKDNLKHYDDKMYKKRGFARLQKPNAMGWEARTCV